METIGDTNATELADTYIDVTSDLAFAQTHYPESKITHYLNNLASAWHNEIYRSHRYRWSLPLVATADVLDRGGAADYVGGSA